MNPAILSIDAFKADRAEMAPSQPEASSLEKQLQNFARFDQESGLLNYDAYCSAINVELARAAANQPTSTLIEIKLKGLSRCIEVVGRKAGLFIIRELVGRYKALDLTDAILGRIDHKTFSIFLCRDNDPVSVLQITKQLIAASERPFNCGKARRSASKPTPALPSPPIRILTRCAHASCSARHSRCHLGGGPGYSFFNPADAEAAKRHNELMAIIAQAVEQRAFHLVYQPFFAFATGKLAGFEALMRLRHPQYGSISPAEFIPIAEEMGLIKRLGAWCIEEACRTAAQWPHHLTVAVNCSPAQFYSGTLHRRRQPGAVEKQFSGLPA